ncbi:hypothetical protein RZS08_36860, partial [Arthrospira platensis SPKY1]|nr:hypothetical protein [Arthrospira platensis SPKY1]
LTEQARKIGQFKQAVLHSVGCGNLVDLDAERIKGEAIGFQQRVIGDQQHLIAGIVMRGDVAADQQASQGGGLMLRIEPARLDRRLNGKHRRAATGVEGRLYPFAEDIGAEGLSRRPRPQRQATAGQQEIAQFYGDFGG